MNARVWTGDRAAPLAQAFAVAGGKIVALGPIPSCPCEDLGGAWVTPGIHDAHMHLATGALLGSRVDLSEAIWAEDAAARVASAARGAQAGEWVRAWGWDHTRWPGARMPDRLLLDRAVPDHPVVATRIDGHTAWVNTAALERLGEADPARHAGILLEQAAERAVAAVPAPSEPIRRRALEEALRQARSVGITSLEDVTEPWALPLYAALRAAGTLTARIAAWLPIDTDRVVAADLRREFPPQDPWIGVGTLKAFLDGTLGSRSAALEAPYADEASSRGVLRVEPAELAEQVRCADEDGWSVALHAIGDRALAVALDALEPLAKRKRVRPHRIEHVQVAAPRDLARLQRTQVLASIQPVHFLDDRAWICARLGAQRAALAYPWRSLVQAGVGIAFGSDWPIASMDPRRGILAAVSRKDAQAELGPGEALTPEEALRGYVSSRTLAAGRDADFVVWSCDPAPRAFPGADEARVLATYVGGRRVWPDLEPVDARGV